MENNKIVLTVNGEDVEYRVLLNIEDVNGKNYVVYTNDEIKENGDVLSYVAEYVYDLCNQVNSFYESVNISKIEDEDVKKDYILVLNKVYEVIKYSLDMLIIEIPIQM